MNVMAALHWFTAGMAVLFGVFVLHASWLGCLVGVVIGSLAIGLLERRAK